MRLRRLSAGRDLALSPGGVGYRARRFRYQARGVSNEGRGRSPRIRRRRSPRCTYAWTGTTSFLKREVGKSDYSVGGGPERSDDAMVNGGSCYYFEVNEMVSRSFSGPPRRHPAQFTISHT